MDAKKLEWLLAAATPGPWSVCEYDAGDKPYLDYNGPCPSIQAPDEYDCAIVHWSGFKQKYWSAANGNQQQITANAAMIALAPDLAADVLRLTARIAQLEAVVAAGDGLAALVADEEMPDWMVGEGRANEINTHDWPGIRKALTTYRAAKEASQ